MNHLHSVCFLVLECVRKCWPVPLKPFGSFTVVGTTVMSLTLTTALLAPPAYGQEELDTYMAELGTVEFQRSEALMRKISLSFDGSEVLVMRKRGQASIIRVDDLVESPVQVDPDCITAWTDSQRGGVIAVLDKETDKTRSRKAKIPVGDLVYFENMAAFREGRYRWSLPHAFSFRSNLVHIEGSDWFAVITPNVRNIGAMQTAINPFTPTIPIDTAITVLDGSGQVLTRVTIPGLVLGIEKEESLSVYHLSEIKEAPLAYEVRKAIVDPTKKKLAANFVLYQQAIRSPKQFFSHRYTDHRIFRVRGGEPGDVRTFVETVLSEPDYFAMNEFHPKYNHSLHVNRTSNLNQIAMRRSEYEFEVARFECRNFCRSYNPTLWNSNHDDATVVPKPSEEASVYCTITDAVMLDGGGIVTYESQHDDIIMESKMFVGVAFFGKPASKARGLLGK